MYEIGNGIQVYFENKKKSRYMVFFRENNCVSYKTSGMLFELIQDDTIYMVTTKVENMIKAFPDYNAEPSSENIINGFRWLHGTIEDEELPVATELFRGTFNEAIIEVANRQESYECVGDFFVKCYELYLSHVKAFSVYVDAIAAYNSGIADEFQAELANCFITGAEEMYDLYTRKCRVRRKNGGTMVDTVQMKNYLQVLIFEYCHMKKENKPLKICQNCGRYFIPLNRSDSIYCHAPSPQNPEKPCSKVGANFRLTMKRRNDPVEREHHTNSCRLQNIVRRLTESGASEGHIAKYQKELQQEKKKYLSEKYGDGGNNNE